MAKFGIAAALVAVLSLCSIVTLVEALKGLPYSPDTDYNRWNRRRSDTRMLNGVYGKCRACHLWQAQLNQFYVQNTTCPFGPFAASIVDHADKNGNEMDVSISYTRRDNVRHTKNGDGFLSYYFFTTFAGTHDLSLFVIKMSFEIKHLPLVAALA